MQLYLIRHAQSVNNALYAASGSYHERSSDPILSEAGRAQAELLARFLGHGDPASETDEHDAFNRKGFGITHLYCSLLRRSVETALTISRSLNVPAIAELDLHEWGGIFEIIGENRDYVGLPGSNRAFFEEHYPTLILPESLNEDGWWSRPHEQRDEAFDRASRFLDELMTRHNGSEDNVALVTHAGFYHSLLTKISGLPLEPENDRWLTKVLFAMNNAAVSRIDFHEHGIVMVYLNRVDFIPRDLIT